jgi:MFS family permease
MLGNLCGPLVGGAVAGSFGLRSVFVLSTAVFVALLAVLYPRLAEPARTDPEIPSRLEGAAPL